jgi:KUP system potassium uptake protein
VSSSRSLPPAVLGALGIVFGDIGTSPLYAFRESFHAAGGAAGGATVIFGLLSLVFWSLALVVTLKYVVYILSADNDGEGGILSLVVLAQRKLKPGSAWIGRVMTLGLVGTALFYCDALITPAISILSAAEGLETLDPGLERAVLPVTLVIIVLLFLLRRGADSIGKLFGPIMLAVHAGRDGRHLGGSTRLCGCHRSRFAFEMLSRGGLSLVIFDLPAVTGVKR